MCVGVVMVGVAPKAQKMIDFSSVQRPGGWC